jgi:ribosomal protein RSM22 (predicted rRNA methylase)
LPPALSSRVEQALESLPRRDINARAARLSEGYRRSEPSKLVVRDETDALAYAITRLPATYAAAASVFSRLAAEQPTFAPTSLLDIGAGPGTATWAAASIFPTLVAATLAEPNPALLALARRFADAAEPQAVRDATYLASDIAHLPADTQADIVVASYALTELERPDATAERLLRAARGVLVLIEPGRPREYERLMRVRRRLAASGVLLGPCPHADACPLPPGDWCHFSVRLPRLRWHMQAKGASVPFEDEKFSYLVVAPHDSPLVRLPLARVLAPPEERNADVTLKLCAPTGLQQRVVASRDREAYKHAKRTRWGDAVAP